MNIAALTVAGMASSRDMTRATINRAMYRDFLKLNSADAPGIGKVLEWQ